MAIYRYLSRPDRGSAKGAQPPSPTAQAEHQVLFECQRQAETACRFLRSPSIRENRPTSRVIARACRVVVEAPLLNNSSLRRLATEDCCRWSPLLSYLGLQRLFFD